MIMVVRSVVTDVDSSWGLRCQHTKYHDTDKHDTPPSNLIKIICYIIIRLLRTIPEHLNVLVTFSLANENVAGKKDIEYSKA